MPTELETGTQQGAGASVMQTLLLGLREGAREELAASLQEADLAGLLQAAQWHGVLALFARRVRAMELTEHLPEEGWRAVQRVLTGQSMRSMAQVAALLQIERAAAGRGIRVLAWKGPALSVQLYGDATLRNSCDLDMLVHRRDMGPLVRAMEEVGFSLCDQGANERATQQARRVHHEVKMFRQRDQIHVELHDEIMPRIFGEWQPLEPCFRRAERVELARGRSVWAPSRIDLLISLSGHGAKHGWYALKWVCDICGFMERFGHGVDWTEVLRETEREGTSRAVLNAVLLSDRMFRTGVPKAVARAAARDARVMEMVQSQEDRLRSGSLERVESDRGWEAPMDLIGSRRKRLAFVIRKTFTTTPTDVEMVDLPEKLSALYVPLRWIRLTGKVTRRAVGRFR